MLGDTGTALEWGLAGGHPHSFAICPDHDLAREESAGRTDQQDLSEGGQAHSCRNETLGNPGRTPPRPREMVRENSAEEAHPGIIIFLESPYSLWSRELFSITLDVVAGPHALGPLGRSLQRCVWDAAIPPAPAV